jgi:CheY-like chemotaxis protein
MNGLETMEAIRAVHCCRCVLMTAYCEEEEAVLVGARRIGIARILAKPFSIAALQSLLLDPAAEFCSKCFANGRRRGRTDCGCRASPLDSLHAA